MRARKLVVLLSSLAVLFSSAIPFSAQTKKDYLSEAEGNKIRDANNPSLRMVLFVNFADDRISKFKYTLAHPAGDVRRAEQLNSLLNAYTGCIDDAADQIEVAREKQQDIRLGLKSLNNKAKDYLTYLQELAKTGAEVDSYKETLDDAIEATQDALADAQKAQKDISAPVRRKQ